MNQPPRELKTVWCFTGRVTDDGPVQVIEINCTPFQIGRRPGVSLTVPRQTVSGVHAEVIEENGTLWIRDLQSTNGTFVNGNPVQSKQQLSAGDLVHIADVALRLTHESATGESHTQAGTMATKNDQAVALIQFDRLLRDRSVIPHFQPVVSLRDSNTVGYEVLGRSALVGLQTPREMFLAASQLNLEEELSQVLRDVGIEKGADLPNCPTLFVNTHPSEVVTSQLLQSLRDLRSINPQLSVTVEIHESAIAAPGAMKRLRDSLHGMKMDLAFDDFGAGQSRLAELANVRPQLVKFDMHLIRDVHRAPQGHRLMLANLVRMVRDLDITPLAEGVECEGEHAVCRDIGFELGQGYYYGRPASFAATLKSLDADCIPV